ncbi:MAG: alpha/beta fold hydrolase [Casimicrobiaceae bacterium]
MKTTFHRAILHAGREARTLVAGVVVVALGATSAAAVETIYVRVGHDSLAASVFPSAHPGRSPLMLLLPGSERASRAMYSKFAAHFAARGFVAVIFDRRGEGESSGLWDEEKSLDQIAADGRSVLHAACKRADVDSTFLAVWGVSQGGWTATIVAAREPAVRLAVLVSDPALTTHEENLNERAWQLREKGSSEQDIAEITDLRRVLWHYYATGEKPADFSARWKVALERPWFKLLEWPRWEPTTDSLSATTLAHYRNNHDPLPYIHASHAAVLRLYGREDHHINSLASLAAARAAYQGIERDTTFVLYPDRGHIMQSTIGSPECRTCPHDMSHFKGGFDFDPPVWNQIDAWLAVRLNRTAVH